MSPDRQHLHHVLQRAGLSSRATIWTTIALAVAVAVAAVALGIGAWQLGIGSDWLFAGFLVLILIAVNLIILSNAWRIAKYMRRWPSDRHAQFDSDPN